MRSLLTTSIVAAFGLGNLWFTPDQRGQRLMDRDHFSEAAEAFDDPMRQGVAWFRAGEFEKAELAFARESTAEAEFNRGTCLIMSGKYVPAIERLDRALELRPGWDDAQVNRSIAVARAERTKQEGADKGDQQIGADEIRFDKNKEPGGEQTQIDEASAISDAAMQALWLRRVQTRPADFLRAKFAYQLAMDDSGSQE